VESAYIYHIYMPRTVSASVERVTANPPAPSPQAARVGVFLKLDAAVVDWFRSGGPGYQARINEVLRQFVQGVTEPDHHPTRVARAQRLFEQYHAQCFWHMRPDLIVTEADVPAIVDGLRTHGGRAGFLAAADLCR
jgi:BrnA antitoxin of type II toxin-antitoxin system